ncbi:hypothetical protein [Geothrix sp. PMB-07]|uniref:hypothetical protein n=1 Tax=Geothrix sp. PMB-07 TaxID=3068640 RepID=UPI002741AE26|nr:hypothetical protein [Geothrix sp. PMB-07]WLT33099.1 hypothetical protein Q9293_07160 [Geothrix sp. PMB-07]
MIQASARQLHPASEPWPWFWRRLGLGWLLTALSLASGVAADRPKAAVPAPRVWGLTTDDPTLDTPRQIEALKALPHRTTLRVVFDPPAEGHPTATDYVPATQALATAAEIMGLPLDSSAMASMDLPTVRRRIAEYLEALSPFVAIWEVGNEVNGNWLGSEVVPKVEAMFDAVTAAGKPSAITFYYEVAPPKGHGLLPWIDANFPKGHRLRKGVSLVLVSYYEDQNQGHRLTPKELGRLFRGLAVRFPKARLAFGEFGWGGGIPAAFSTRSDLLRRMYGYRVPSVPAFVGGGFYWHFRQTMVPQTSPDWEVLHRLQAQAP